MVEAGWPRLIPFWIVEGIRPRTPNYAGIWGPKEPRNIRRRRRAWRNIQSKYDLCFIQNKRSIRIAPDAAVGTRSWLTNFAGARTNHSVSGPV